MRAFREPLPGALEIVLNLRGARRCRPAKGGNHHRRTPKARATFRTAIPDAAAFWSAGTKLAESPLCLRTNLRCAPCVDCPFEVALVGMPTRFCRALAGGVMVAQGSLEPLVMVRIHAGQPFHRLSRCLKPWCRRFDRRLKSQHSRRAHLPS